MVNLEKILSTVTDGIPFSIMSKQSKSKRKSRKSKRKSRKGSIVNRKKRKITAQRHRRGSALRVPPKGVIIRKGTKLYKSNGKKMILLKN